MIFLGSPFSLPFPHLTPLGGGFCFHRLLWAKTDLFTAHFARRIAFFFWLPIVLEILSSPTLLSSVVHAQSSPSTLLSRIWSTQYQWGTAIWLVDKGQQPRVDVKLIHNLQEYAKWRHILASQRCIYNYVCGSTDHGHIYLSDWLKYGATGHTPEDCVSTWHVVWVVALCWHWVKIASISLHMRLLCSFACKLHWSNILCS